MQSPIRCSEWFPRTGPFFPASARPNLKPAVVPRIFERTDHRVPEQRQIKACLARTRSGRRPFLPSWPRCHDQNWYSDCHSNLDIAKARGRIELV
jgi:hypothetical protein